MGGQTVSAAAVASAAASSASAKVTPSVSEQSLVSTESLPSKPMFPALRAGKGGARVGGVRAQFRRVAVPPNRMTPLKAQWMEIYEPVVKQLKLQIRMNLRGRAVELKTSDETVDTGALQKGADFVRAFMMGFAIRDAVALVRLDDLYLETFDIADIRQQLKGDHVARAVGRLAGSGGKTKFTIENATKTRIVIADTKISILGSYDNTRLARHSICSLVLGSAPGKVYNRLRNVSARLNESF